ncbi:restriction endonuclease subunit R [Heliorestis acidaminivorans]|uniref:Restriction endonuclease subunit R n=1 Tax=Heliorestis acidaminivorans TaxID=553427 RepID=A0A6I0F2M9_9FIRM|nr:DEAD/DEAH box helicase family protein [Heliorestis acidaminivorans]KAB2954241.1 restriction endonuclease subunit R [Heliorestis acidaminivorans]
MSNAIVGKEDHLLSYLTKSITKAQNIRLIIAFIMESGAKKITDHLQVAAQRGVPIQILTGRYMAVTEPSAIYYLKDRLGASLDIRFFYERTRSFHPKAYIFEHGKGEGEIYVGSSNLSLSALTSGVEWNFHFTTAEHQDQYQKFTNTFEDLFYHHSEKITDKVLQEYAAHWKKPSFVKHEEAFESEKKGKTEAVAVVEPRGAQIEALFELKRARSEGVNKGIVVAATGVGKTYLAAFDSLNFKRILFVAHREEILRQAEASFKQIRPNTKTGMFAGFRKDEVADIYFATIQTLSRSQHLEKFSPDYFDYIVVDEFHHAGADSYLNILNYFRPKFLLGLTATPFRSDNRDIFALCDDHLIYEIYLKDAINRDLLVPFDYYGVFDETDYFEVAYRNGKYVLEELEMQLLRQERADLVLNHYRKLAGERTIGFCASIHHADFMSAYFNEKGIPATAVHSGRNESGQSMERVEAINAINNGDLQVIFAVDIFNEGIDIPSIDTVMFLRPTESMVIFLQQLGRGLRKYERKERLTVLDFIGNYKKAHYIPSLLAGDNPMDPKTQRIRKIQNYDFPDNCRVQFDMKVIELFEQLANNDPLPKRMRDEYFRIKEQIGRKPWRVDMFKGCDIPTREYLKRGWLRFLADIEELTEEEKSWLDTIVEQFFRQVEKTSMAKLYKIPTIGAFIDGDKLHLQVPLKTIGERFQHFYHEYPLHQKDLQDKSNSDWRNWVLDDFMKLAKKNPVHFLSKGKESFFHYDEINRIFSLPKELGEYATPALTDHLKDILDYRRLSFSRRFK